MQFCWPLFLSLLVVASSWATEYTSPGIHSSDFVWATEIGLVYRPTGLMPIPRQFLQLDWILSVEATGV